ncbi:YfiH family protein [Bacillus ectoiniformans]|uniref:peptidoglycan editing factor PgeF n=1 Tax=Bacillus ectoiniformans TaxID=1494429 RepID=UPI001958741A|nr:peptidoglycan editing factor PgeF [Bacillus ectoiniformans]MBM7647208.1 YfiH family protein [Bacillus ectoiniformans]
MTEPFISLHNSFYTIKDWTDQDPELAAGFTTKLGGVSSGDFHSLNLGFHVKDKSEDVCANRRLAGDLLDFPVENWVAAEQTHGSRIVQVSTLDRGKGALNYEEGYRGTDGFYTDEKGVLLTLGFADCVPLYFYSKNRDRIGIAHAGWKGTVSGIGREMIKAWQKDGIDAEDILAVIGPSICSQCYIVDERVIREVRPWVHPSETPPFQPVPGKSSEYHLSLQQLNESILLQSGLKKEQIQTTSLCTSCSSEFFSHRRDQGRTGRMMSFIGWKENATS